MSVVRVRREANTVSNLHDDDGGQPEEKKKEKEQSPRCAMTARASKKGARTFSLCHRSSSKMIVVSHSVGMAPDGLSFWSTLRVVVGRRPARLRAIVIIIMMIFRGGTTPCSDSARKGDETCSAAASNYFCASAAC